MANCRRLPQDHGQATDRGKLQVLREYIPDMEGADGAFGETYGGHFVAGAGSDFG